MTQEKEIIDGIEYDVLLADEGKDLIRIIDEFNFGDKIYLGVDWSTGKARQDKAEYYREDPKEESEEVEMGE